MHSYSLLLLAAFLVAVDCKAMAGTTAKTLRGSQSQDQIIIQERKSRRRLVEEITCDLFLQDVSFKPTEDQPDGHIESRWVCEFSQEDAVRIGMHFVQLTDQGDDPRFRDAVSGLSTFSINHAMIDDDTAKMYLPSSAQMAIAPKTDDRGRRLATKKVTGAFNTLMVRVIDSTGHGPTKNKDELRNDVFEDEACLKTQMEACSYNKMTIEPYNAEGAENGLYDLNVDFDIEQDPDQNKLLDAAMGAFKTKFGSPHGEKFDLVMFCMPPSQDSSWLAFGYVNSPISVYSNDWCSFSSGQMHEVGHNLNLEHSGVDGGDEYADMTGVMGISYAEDDTKMCFNSAKNWQLGWYSDQSKSIIPLNKNKPVQRFTLNGVADYTKNTKALVSLRLEQKSSTPDYYVGYNRKSGITSGVNQDIDMITIVRKETGPEDYGFSWKVASLPVGGSYVIKKFDGQRDVEIKFVGSTNDDRDAIVDIIDIDFAPREEPEACEEYTIEVKTDNHPEDTTWLVREIAGIRRGFGFSPKYTAKLTVQSTKVCLPYENDYKFTIEDGYEDGLCCKQGEGYYRILDSENNEIAKGGENFKKDEISIKVGPNPNSANVTPAQKPIEKPKRCKDRRGKFRFKKNGRKRRTCRHYARKGHCRKRANGTPVWKICPKSCKRCDSLDAELSAAEVERLLD